MYGKVLGLVCLLLVTPLAVADDWDDAIAAYDGKRYDEVFALLAPMAQPSNIVAQLLLYDTYTTGHAALTDDAARFAWTRRGAKLGVAPAQEQLAQNYLNGTGVEPDETRAAHWFELAADQWYGPAAYNLGVLTLNGQGVEPNLGYAVGLFIRAAELKEPYALYVLGGMYLEGRYVAPDMDIGLYYLSQAAYFGQRRAMALMGIVMQDVPDDPNRLVKSAFYLRRALAAGCSDVADLTAQAIDRLSPGEIRTLEDNLVAWEPDLTPYDMKLLPGPCLS